MVIALLTLPAAVAGHFSKKLWQMMIGAVIATAIFVVLGLGISYSWDLPTGPVIIVLAGVTYFAVAAGKRN
jgi:zinc transport system permease protein